MEEACAICNALRMSNKQKVTTHFTHILCIVCKVPLVHSPHSPLFPFPILPVQEVAAPTRSVLSAIKSALVHLVVMGYAGLRLL